MNSFNKFFGIACHVGFNVAKDGWTIKVTITFILITRKPERLFFVGIENNIIVKKRFKLLLKCNYI